MPKKPILIASCQNMFQMIKFMAVENRQTRKELRKVAFKILPTFLASGRSTDPPKADPTINPINMGVKTEVFIMNVVL